MRVAGPGFGLAPVGLELRPGRLDRIEVWRVGRQEQQLGSTRLDQFHHTIDLVRRKVIHDDYVTRVQSWGQVLRDIGAKDLTVHRTFKNQWRLHARKTQGRHRRQIASGTLSTTRSSVGAQP